VCVCVCASRNQEKFIYTTVYTRVCMCVSGKSREENNEMMREFQFALIFPRNKRLYVHATPSVLCIVGTHQNFSQAVCVCVAFVL